MENMNKLLAASLFAALLAPVAGAQTKSSSTQVAARVALVTGSVTTGAGESTKSLGTGDAVYEGETVHVGPNSYANLKFEDGGRVLLRPGTEFAIESYRFTAAPAAAAPTSKATPTTVATSGADASAFFRVLRGGFRAISGLIGKADHQQYRVTTPAATIGIRGTDYEVQTCEADCPSQAKAMAGGTDVAANSLAGLELAQAGGGAAGGVIVATHQGSIVLRTSRGDFNVDAGQVALALTSGQTFMLPVIPDVMLQNPTPSPEACE